MPSPNYPVGIIKAQLVKTIPFSFETGEVGTIDLPVFPYRFKIVKAVAVNQKAVAGTDNGTITIGKGATVYGTITYTASAAQNTAATATITANSFEQTDQVRIVTAKSTAGGKGILVLTVQIMPSH